MPYGIAKNLNKGITVNIEGEQTEFLNGIWTLTFPSMGEDVVWYLKDKGCITILLFNTEAEAHDAAEKFRKKVEGMKACYFGDVARTVDTLRAMIGSMCTHASLVLPARTLIYHPLKKVADAFEAATS